MSYQALFQKVYDLLKWVYPTVRKFPKDQRSVLSQRIEVTSIRILEMVIDFSENDTRTNRKKILHEIDKLQILLRLCKDLSFLKFRQYEYVSSLLTEISKILDTELKTQDFGELAKLGGGVRSKSGSESASHCEVDAEMSRVNETRSWVFSLELTIMFYSGIYKELCSFRNLELAYKKARRGKRNKKSVQDFEFDLERNLLKIKHELETGTYKPRHLKQFVIRDPKTRLISASDFRDRVVYHSLCNIIQPIFEKGFIYDSHANQIDKGSSKAIERFDIFKRKITENGRLVNKPLDNNIIIGYVLKADIKHFFDTVDHQVLIACIKSKIKDEKILELIQEILDNHTTETGKGMPIGNLTSQFFANLYLNELDYFLKHELKVKFYIRYVDDFVLLNKSKENLEIIKLKINNFLSTINLELHPEKSQIYSLYKGVKFLGFRIFYHYKLLNKRSVRKMRYRMKEFETKYKECHMNKNDIQNSLVSWFGYAEQANTYKMRKKINIDFTTI